ncbi:flagellar protein FliS [Erwinia persicina]|jgi:flagellar protein FliS|uniref:Flagellar secretion chaperone FliS n=1 Tax=Erwinia plantamica TaxID=3237104 RepID=A0ABW7CGY6_9GAMM|nr:MULTISPECIES: flagellar export chaperone FliS [Erwinia]MCP1440626.1 flagellar protein FliS [Erwinia persicina]MDN4626036.1 flagellar export chaperone FliS [Erwinia sp. PsM31]MDN8542311.1 flagellar export chaperone FliS [Erwinia sp. BC051422]RRZ94421.1 flagella export chaperone FliS [Erwinia sp. 198]
MYKDSGAQLYRKVGLESSVLGASQQQLTTLLFDGALSALVRARLFMLDGQIEGKGNAISKAINIIENGLKVGLVDESGDELAANLLALYDYMIRRLLQGNLQNDVAAVQEVEDLLRNIADAWKEVTVNTVLQDAV